MQGQNLRPEHDIFGDLHSAEQLDSIEHNLTKTIAPFQGSIDPNAETTLVDPRQLVTVYLRPGRQYSMVTDPAAFAMARAQGYKIEPGAPGVSATAHFIAGKPYRVARQTFEANRAVLCDPREYAVLKHQAASPHSQEVTRQIQEMRKHSVETSQRMMSPEQRTKVETLRKAEKAPEEIEREAYAMRDKAIDEKKASEAAAAASKRDSILGAMSAEDLEVYCAATISQADEMSQSFGERGRAQVMQAANEQADEDRSRWHQLHPSTGREENHTEPSSAADRVRKLKALLTAGLIDQSDFDRQLLALVS